VQNIVPCGIAHKGVGCIADSDGDAGVTVAQVRAQVSLAI
jgi:lipoate-protein ligase B